VILPGDKVFMHFLGGYEYHKSDIKGNFLVKGTRKYSDKFKEYFILTFYEKSIYFFCGVAFNTY